MILPDYAIVIVGIGQWGKYTAPLLRSIGKHAYDATRVVVVDNGGYYTGQQIDKFPWVDFVRWSTDPCSYAVASNIGLEKIWDETHLDWVLLMNNDVICHDDPVPYLEKLSQGCLYGNNIHTRNGDTWIDGWLYAIPYPAMINIGLFDPAFWGACFEDLDYCLRARDEGYSIRQSYLPFIHKVSRQRMDMPEYDQNRQHNIEYIKKKWRLEWDIK